MTHALFLSSIPPRPSPPVPVSNRTITVTRCTAHDSETPPWVSTQNVPIAPWMTSPNHIAPDIPSNTVTEQENPTPTFLTENVRGGRGRRAMRGIISSISKLRETCPSPVHEEPPDFGRRAPWTKAEERMVFRREKKEKKVTAAERSLPEPLLVRLRGEARGMKKWVKAKKAGVTEEVVVGIKNAWRRSELAMVKIVDPLCRNMERAQEIVEDKTGGLVILSKKDTLVVYRGSGYSAFRDPSLERQYGESAGVYSERSGTIVDGAVSDEDRGSPNSELVGMTLEAQRGEESIKGALYEREADRLLDELGPRFIDWWHRKPLPVDADMLPEVVPNFMTPFRLCPPQVRHNLTDDELTYLRRLAQPLPTHFALGKNTRLQGLAYAILKLWEKSLIAKIAVKIGIQNTNHHQMSSELKRLTGGVLILSNKFYIILYRGNNFLSSTVSKSIIERERILRNHQLQEEEARLKAVRPVCDIDESEISPTTVGSYAEFQLIQDSYVPFNKGLSIIEVQTAAEKEKLEKEVRQQERRLVNLKKKIQNSEEVLSNLTSSLGNSEQCADQELLTIEERQTFLKIGLKMDGFLLLGRRGVYDGIIGSIHQHWKHREVVNVITMQKSFQQIMYSARLLEIESGGILVGVQKRSKGHSIIIYRGKNYTRPLKLLSGNFLTKKQALERSIEIQRRGSMKYFAYQRHVTILELKRRLSHLDQQTLDI